MSDVAAPGVLLISIGCRFCRSVEGQVVLDLGHQPSSELFPKDGDHGPDPVFPLRMWLCAGCGLAQLADDADVPEEPLGEEPRALVNQRRDAVTHLMEVGILPASGTITEFPSPHGGTWLDLLGGARTDREQSRGAGRCRGGRLLRDHARA